MLAVLDDSWAAAKLEPDGGRASALSSPAVFEPVFLFF